MAKNKSTRSLKRRKRSDIPAVTGKIVEAIELRPAGTGYEIGILFTDRTYLGFEVEPCFTILPELSDWKTGNYKPLQRFPMIHSR